jgi:hypothetical protein
MCDKERRARNRCKKTKVRRAIIYISCMKMTDLIVRNVGLKVVL